MPVSGLNENATCAKQKRSFAGAQDDKRGYALLYSVILRLKAEESFPSIWRDSSAFLLRHSSKKGLKCPAFAGILKGRIQPDFIN